MTNTGKPKKDNLIWANLVHLSYNMWSDIELPDINDGYYAAKPYLRFDDSLWNDILKQMVAAGMNMLVIDLGDGVKYESHPEIAVEGAWSIARLKQELDRAREMGLEPIPKLNFSTCHDTWMGPYARMVSTDTYYAVCRDLIAETISLFDKPRFFHLGMDEETYEHQRRYEYVVIRQHDLWWRDIYFLFEQVEKGGARPWIWSDYLWHHPELFLHKMPKSVVQSNWYYGEKFSDDLTGPKAYIDLEAHGYEQIPTGSNWTLPENFPSTVAFCKQHIAPERLLGFFQTSWKPTLEACRDRHEQAIEMVRQGRSKF
ncbi:Tat pathway signal protein [candidate division KSB1 bacterium]|nr:Tat pathway signal protein [candidate division KSB1 bacterium]